MFILEKLEGKNKVIVATAISREDAVEKVSIERDNGIILTVTEVIEDKNLFKERDYDEEFIALVQQFKDVTEKIRQFPLKKVKLSAKEYQSAVNPITNFDMDGFLMNIAEPHQLYIGLGDYGYGRSIEWTTSNGVTTGEWVSSSSTC